MTNATRKIIADINNALDAATMTDAQRIDFAGKMARSLVPEAADANDYKAFKKEVAARREVINMLAGNCLRPVRNVMTGATVMERVDTPYCCSVRSESYFCN